jgi:DNA-binding transcriptional regulator GbsR (MarR family)
MTDDVHRDDPPLFDRPMEGEDTKHRVYGAVLHAREPTTVSKIAEWADCSDDSARTYLSFYADLGIVIRQGDRPVRYQRNNDYFEWRRVHELAQESTVYELQSRVSELTDRIEEYQDEYDADSPVEVNIPEFGEAQIDDVRVDLGDWATAIEERRLYERARTKVARST